LATTPGVCTRPSPGRCTRTPGRGRSRRAIPQLIGHPEEETFGAADVAEPVHIFVLHYFADELRATRAESGERLVEVIDSEHDA
jgi:hypothetical protein